MKKWLCLLLTGSLIFSLSACQRGQNVDTPSDATDTSTHISSGNTMETGSDVTEGTLHRPPENTTEGTITTAEAYADFLDAYVEDRSLFYFTKDIDNNGTEELIIHQDTGIEVYTYEASVKMVGAHDFIHDFITETLLLHHTNDKKYPGIVYVICGGGKYRFGYITITDGVLTVQQTFDEMLSGKKETVYYTQDFYLIALSRKVWEDEALRYRLGYSVWEPKIKEELYVLREITDDRVKIENNQKIYNDNFFFSLTLPVDWKGLEQQGQDGRSHFFRDPVLGENCQFSLHVTGAEYLYERTPEQYREYLSNSHQNLVIDSITKETIQGYQCTKVVYSYTKDETKFINVWYVNLIVGRRLFDFSIIYPADQKDTYEPILAAIVDSVLFYQAK